MEEEFFWGIFDEGNKEGSVRGGKKIKVEEKEGKENGEEEGDEEVIEQGGDGKSSEMKEEEGKGKCENGSLKGEGGAEVGAEEIATLIDPWRS